MSGNSLNSLTYFFQYLSVQLVDEFKLFAGPSQVAQPQKAPEVKVNQGGTGSGGAMTAYDMYMQRMSDFEKEGSEALSNQFQKNLSKSTLMSLYRRGTGARRV